MLEPSPRTPLQTAFGAARRGLAVVAAISLFINALALTSTLYMYQVYDRVLTSGRVETLAMLTIVAAFAFGVMGLLEILRSRAFLRIGQWLDRALSAPLIEASVRETLAGRPIGMQALRDLGQIRGFVASPAMFPVLDAPWAPIFLLVVWLLHPWLGAFAAVSALALLAVALVNERATQAPLQEANEALVVAFRQGEGALRNAEVAHAMGMLPALIGRWAQAAEHVHGCHRIAGDRSAGFMGLAKFLRVLVQSAILGLGAYLAIAGELTGGGMIAASILLGKALAPVDQAIGSWKSFAAARAAHGRLQALLSRHPERPPAIRLPTPAGRLTLDRLTFTPPGADRPALRQVSLQLEPGETLAVVGPSASGKSTLCRLIVGIWPPSSGHARLDGAEAHGWCRVDFGRHVGYLPQEVELFAGTVKDNIARMGEAPDEAVIAAARLAGAHEMILGLPGGYATEIGSGVGVLSGGQRQRIGLARALFGDPRLIVLDEPNASLDQAGEAILAEALGRIRGRATIVLVTHRPSLLAHVDKMLVMKQGTVELFGPRDQILPRLIAPRPAQRATGAA